MCTSSDAGSERHDGNADFSSLREIYRLLNLMLLQQNPRTPRRLGLAISGERVGICPP